ncbi:MAG: tRNA-dihydrouridine synthase family protein [Verrucomicrobiae bacterium]
MNNLFPIGRPVLALAPMQDVTDWAFWKLMSSYGGPDIYFTEYFRVTSGYRPERAILRSITENPTGKPAVAQIIGNDVGWMVKTARRLERYPVAAVDLNLGCPAPVVYRKCAGGGLLRDPARVDEILGALRGGIERGFTVKTRLGFADPGEFDRLLEIFSRHRLDLLTVHGRTVREKFGPHVHLGRIARAVQSLPFPVIANGNISSVEEALHMLEATGARGLMIGRGAVRNPWIFRQIRDRLEGREVTLPTGRDVLAYVEALYEAGCAGAAPEFSRVQKMKKYMNFLGEGISPAFLHAIRRVSTRQEFFDTCRTALDHDTPMPLVPSPT